MIPKGKILFSIKNKHYPEIYSSYEDYFKIGESRLVDFDGVYMVCIKNNPTCFDIVNGMDEQGNSIEIDDYYLTGEIGG
jgi:hypothetical protein